MRKHHSYAANAYDESNLNGCKRKVLSVEILQFDKVLGTIHLEFAS